MTNKERQERQRKFVAWAREQRVSLRFLGTGGVQTRDPQEQLQDTLEMEAEMRRFRDGEA